MPVHDAAITVPAPQVFDDVTAFQSSRAYGRHPVRDLRATLDIFPDDLVRCNGTYRESLLSVGCGFSSVDSSTTAGDKSYPEAEKAQRNESDARGCRPMRLAVRLAADRLNLREARLRVSVAEDQDSKHDHRD
jgi:hypothetical protein